MQPEPKSISFSGEPPASQETCLFLPKLLEAHWGQELPFTNSNKIRSLGFIFASGSHQLCELELLVDLSEQGSHVIYSPDQEASETEREN